MRYTNQPLVGGTVGRDGTGPHGRGMGPGRGVRDECPYDLSGVPAVGGPPPVRVEDVGESIFDVGRRQFAHQPKRHFGYGGGRRRGVPQKMGQPSALKHMGMSPVYGPPGIVASNKGCGPMKPVGKIKLMGLPGVAGVTYRG